MIINMYVQWFERKPDFSPDYYKKHHRIISGETPEECMRQLRAFDDNHDLAKYTVTEILYIYS